MADNRTLPRSLENERALLGAVLVDDGTLDAVTERIGEEDFSTSSHRLIFRAMQKLAAEGKPIDLRTLQSEIEVQGTLDAVGGLAYLARLDLDLPDLGRVDHYVDIVKERSLRRQFIEGVDGLRAKSLGGELDAPRALRQADELVSSLSVQVSRPRFLTLSSAVPAALEEIERRAEGGEPGLMTGFSDLDSKLAGLRPGNLVVLAARPGVGKSALATKIAQNLALREARPVAYFSLEMTTQELVERILSSESSINLKRLRQGRLTSAEWETLVRSAEKVAKGPLYIDDSFDTTFDSVIGRAKRLRREKQIELLIIDYLQLLQLGRRTENRTLEVAAMTRSLKRLAKDLEMPVMVLSQLSREPEKGQKKRKPRLVDLRESGAIEQDADIVLLIDRNAEIPADDAPRKDLSDLIVAKNRNGEQGLVKLVFIGETTSFFSLARTGTSDSPTT